MTLLIFILILSLLVLIHELGHFVAAKKSGVKVEEFGLGIPPRLFGKKFGETIYSLNWLPFGGFVKLYGEDSTDKVIEKDSHSFISKPWYKRIAIIVAGVFMNFILAVVLYYVFFAFNGYKTFSMPLIFDYDFKYGTSIKSNTVVLGISEESNSASSGLEVGDIIKKINGVDVNDSSEIKSQVAKNYDNVEVLVEKYPSGDLATYSFKPMLAENGDPILGVFLGKSLRLDYSSTYDKALVGFMHSYNVLSYSVSSLGQVISMSIESKDIAPVSETVSGPVGIYNVVGAIVKHSEDKVFLSLIDFTAMLSLSLAFLNILPLPALDGGRLFFILIELLRGGKKVSAELEAKIHGIGMFLLLSLFVLITIKDITL